MQLNRFVVEPAGEKINFRIINWMRGLAALYVVINHSRGRLFTDITRYSADVLPKHSWGWWQWLNVTLMLHTSIGVEFVTLFFILSGFSMAHSLSANNNIPAFYSRRMIRLYAPYMLGIIWALVVFLLIRALAPEIFFKTIDGFVPLSQLYQRFANTRTLLLNLVYIPTGNSLTPQYWSLPFEIVFYLTIPWFIKRFKIYAIVTVALFAVGIIFTGLSTDAEQGTFFKQYLFDYNIFFLAGIVFYKYKDFFIKNFIISRKATIVLLFLLFEMIIVSKAYMFHNVTNKVTNMFMTLFTFVLLFGSLKHQITVGFLDKIGNFSYTLYVTHFATITLVNLVSYKAGLRFYNIETMYVWYFGIVLSLIVAYGFYFIVERPSNKYLQKIRAANKNEKAIQVMEVLPIFISSTTTDA